MSKYVTEDSFDIDTKDLYSSGVEFGKICNAIEEELNDLYDKIINLEGSNIWTGVSAKKFINKAKREKNELIKFNNALREYGKCLCDIAEEYDSFPTKVGVE